MTPTITPKIGKRYVTRGGWITPPIVQSESESYPFTTIDRSIMYSDNGRYSIGGHDDDFDLVAEHVEPSVTDTFRRDLIARLYVAMISAAYANRDFIDYGKASELAVSAADKLIEAMEDKQ